MKILHSLEGTSWSGGQQQALFLAVEQQKLGHEVLLACQKGSVLEQRGREAGLRLYPNDYRKEINPISIFNLLRAFDSFQPDIVNVHRAWAHTQWVLISLLRRFKGLVVTRRVLFRPDKNPVSLVKYRTPAVRGYIAVSDAVADRLQQVGVGARRIRVVFSASDTERFSPDNYHELQENLPFDNVSSTGNLPPVALMVGNFSRNKGHLVLLDAFKKIFLQWPELHLLVAGNGTDGSELKNIVAAAGIGSRVGLLGFRSDVPALLQRSLFSVNASYQEGFSGTIRESLAMGVPVIASAIPANVEISGKIPLKLFPAGDADALAQSMLKFKDCPSFLPDKNLLRQKAIEHFSVAAMVQNTLTAYSSILKA